MLERTPFGVLPDGRPVDAFTIASAKGLQVRAITYGGVITSIITPDRTGSAGDIVLGHGEIEPYVRHKTYFGAIIGRFANRIRNGRFSLGGREYQLTCNQGRTHLHGGITGFDSRLWDAEEVRSPTGDGVVFSRVSRDGEEGYPGTLGVRVGYLVTGANELRVEYEAETDAATVLNLTQHSYFNLSAGRAADVLDHALTLHADHYTPVDAEQIPTGEIQPVAGTPFDFRTSRRIGDGIEASADQLAYGGGYDHNWIVRRAGDDELAPAAHVVEPISGRTLEVFTTQPGIQFYSGNKLDGSVPGKQGAPYRTRAGLCLETQHFPNAPNEPDFPSTVLRAGEVFRSTTVFRFGVRKG